MQPRVWKHVSEVIYLIDAERPDIDFSFYSALAQVLLVKKELAHLVKRATVHQIASCWESGMELSEEILRRKAKKLPNSDVILRYFSQDKTAQKTTKTTKTLTVAPTSSMPGTPATAPGSPVAVTSEGSTSTITSTQKHDRQAGADGDGSDTGPSSDGKSLGEGESPTIGRQRRILGTFE